MTDIQQKEHLVLGQKYAFATISLILGVMSFVNLLGLEKPILAVVFGWLALRAVPGPRLTEHRVWAQAGIVLGLIMIVAVPVLIFLNFDKILELFDMFSKMR